MAFTSSHSIKKLEDLLHRMTDRIRRSLELPEILDATVDEMRQFLKVDRVKIYQFQKDGSGEVVAEAIKDDRLPSLLGQRFPADDIPVPAREMFLTFRQRSIVDISTGEIGTSLLPQNPEEGGSPAEIFFRTIDPCHVEYLTAMDVQSSLVVPILYQYRLWGLLVAHHSSPRRFGKKELEVVQLVADQATVAISHAALLELTRSQGQHEAIVNQAVSRLHSTVKAPLKNALSYMVKALQCAGGRLYLPEMDSTQRSPIVTSGIQPTLGEPLEDLPIWKNWLTTEALTQPVSNLWVFSDIRLANMPPELFSIFTSQNIRSLLLIKLTHRNRLLGYLSLFRQPIDTETLWAGMLDQHDPRQQKPRASFEAWREIKQNQANPWSSREISIFQDLAEQTASVVYQMQLYQEVQTLNTQLEQRVLQRTAELQRLNESLTQEISERERAFLELQSARDAIKRLGHQNELILNSAGEGIYGIDLSGKIVFANVAAARMLGYEKQAIANLFMHDLAHHSTPEGAAYDWRENPIYNTLKYGQTHHVSGDLFERKDGFTFPTEYVSAPIREQGHIIGAVVVFKDITERQMVESMRDEFVAVVSHELRTPLTSIRSALGLLSQETLEIPASKRQRMMEIAFSNTNRLVRLVSDILDVEQIKLGKITLNKQVCELSELIAQAIDEMNAMAEHEGIQLSSEVAAVQLRVDPDRIIQTLTNLLSNAIKFSPSGSKIEILAQIVDASNTALVKQTLSATGRAAIDSTLDGSRQIVLLSVKDQGRGIAQDKLEAVFNQFVQLNTGDSGHQGGTGLGLAICRSIIQQHKGKIWVQSAVDVGSTFFLTLPALTSDTLD